MRRGRRCSTRSVSSERSSSSSSVVLPHSSTSSQMVASSVNVDAPNLPLSMQVVRGCAVELFHYADPSDVSFSELYARATRLFPDLPPEARQSVAVVVELCAPILRRLRKAVDPHREASFVPPDALEQPPVAEEPSVDVRADDVFDVATTSAVLSSPAPEISLARSVADTLPPALSASEHELGTIPIAQSVPPSVLLQEDSPLPFDRDCFVRLSRLPPMTSDSVLVDLDPANMSFSLCEPANDHPTTVVSERTIDSNAGLLSGVAMHSTDTPFASSVERSPTPVKEERPLSRMVMTVSASWDCNPRWILPVQRRSPCHRQRLCLTHEPCRVLVAAVVVVKNGSPRQAVRSTTFSFMFYCFLSEQC